MISPAVLDLLRDRNFLRLWITGAVTGTFRWLEILAIGVYTLEVTGSPLSVALMLFARILPGVFLGTVTGTLASRFNRKWFLVCGLCLLSLTGCVGAILSYSGLLQLWHIALGAIIGGSVWTLEHPVRRTLLGDIAGVQRLPTTMSLDQTTFNLTRMLGPLLGGTLYMLLGMGGIYTLAALAFAGASVLVASTTTSDESQRSSTTESFWTTLVQGVKYVSGRPILRSVLVITLIENFFGFSYASMVPVFGKQVLSLDAGNIGLLQSMEGIGATLGAMVLALSTITLHYGRTFVFGAMLFLVGVLIFALSHSFAFACLGLLISGPGLAAFGAMQSTIMLHDSDPAQRTRVMGVLVMCIGAGGPLGVITMGLLATWFGPVTALVSMVITGLFLLTIALYTAPALVNSTR